MRLPDALASVAFCDEVIVIDSGSVDGTRDVARAAGATVVENPWPGFAAQRNVALDHARGEWAFELDADERVSPGLRAEVEALLAGPPPSDIDMCVIPLRNRFLGGSLAGSARYPHYRVRLFRRAAYRHDEQRTVHEGLWPRRPVHVLEGEIEHLLAGSVGEALRDTWAYARLEAGQGTGRPTATAAVVGIVARPLAKAFYRLIVYGGWRDGWRGWLKVGLDSGSDAVVWVRQLIAPVSGQAAVAQRAHFSPVVRVGPVRIAGVAAGATATRRAADWLTAAREAGADVVLITDAPGEVRDIYSLRVRPVSHLGPLLILRSLDAESQVRPLDAVMAAGRRERLLVRALPANQRGFGTLDLTIDPAAAERQVRAASRTRSG